MQVRRICLSNIMVEGELLIDCINRSCTIPWRLRILINDILFLVASFNNFRFTYVWRGANFAVHAYATHGLSLSSGVIWISASPLLARHALYFYTSCTGCPRALCFNLFDFSKKKKKKEKMKNFNTSD